MRTRLALAILTGLLLQGCQLMHSSPGAQIARLAGTSWRAESIGGVAVSPEIESTLEADAETHIAGRGGCNPYVSDIGVEAGGIRFSDVMAAKVRCPPEQVDQEKRFFAALSAARKLKVTRDRLLLLDENGGSLAQLKRETLTIRTP